jgi:hypothetical protein
MREGDDALARTEKLLSDKHYRTVVGLLSPWVRKHPDDARGVVVVPLPSRIYLLSSAASVVNRPGHSTHGRDNRATDGRRPGLGEHAVPGSPRTNYG